MVAEAMEEVIVDNFVETLFQSLVRTIGGTDALGHWISTLITSMRETKMFNFFSSGPETITNSGNNIHNEVLNTAAQQSTDIATETQTQERILHLKDALAIMRAQAKEGKTIISQLFGAGLFGGLMLFMPAFAGFSLYGLKSVLNFISKKYDAHLKHKVIERHSQQLIESLLVDGEIVEDLKKPFVDATEERISEVSNVQITPEYEFDTNFHPMGKVNYLSHYGFDPNSRKPITDSDIKDEAYKMIIKDNLEKLDNIKNIISEELLSIGIEFTKIELSKLAETISDYSQFFSSESYIFSNIAPQGAVNYHLFKLISEKLDSGQEITELEELIYRKASFTTGGSTTNQYGALYDKAAKQEGPSKYANHFRLFIDNLFRLLSDKNLITDLNKLNTILKVSVFVGGEGGGSWERQELGDFIDDMSNGRKWNIDEINLDNWFVLIENKINSIGRIIDKQGLIRDIQTLFENYLFISGYMRKNTFYRILRLLPLRIGEILKESGDIRYNNYNQIDELIGRKSCQSLCARVSQRQDTIPDSGSAIGFLSSVLAHATELSLTQIEEIKKIVSDYVEIVNVHKGIKDHLVRYPDCPRKDLIQRIMTKIPFLKDAPSRNAISRLLFGNTRYIDDGFLDSRRTNREDPTPRLLKRPKLFTVWRIILTSMKWTPEAFLEFGVALDRSTINFLRTEVKTVVDEWVFENNYPSVYIYESPRRRVSSHRFTTFDKYYLLPEYELIQYLWLASAVHADKLDYGLNTLAKDLEYGQLDIILHTAEHDISIKGLRNIFKKINKWAGEEASIVSLGVAGIPISEKLGVYREALEKIVLFMNERDLSFLEPRRKSWYDRKLWYSEVSRSYHSIFLFARQLGFHPLSFTPLRDAIFKSRPIQRSDGSVIWTSDYCRHHLDPSNKESIYFSDLVLTDVKMHNYYEMFGEANTRLLLHKFEVMISHDGTGKNGAWTKVDILNLFKDTSQGFQDTLFYHKATGWFNNKFENNLRKFNDRRILYKSKGLEALILEADTKYDNLYNRFYQKVKCDEGRRIWFFSKPLKPYGLVDFASIIALEFYLSHNPCRTQKFAELSRFI
jgi:hypothetical protein